MPLPLAMAFDLFAVDGASPVFNRVAVSADRAAVATGRAEKAGLGFGKTMKAAFAGLAIGAVAVEAVKAASQFQKSMLAIQTQAGASAREVKTFSSALLTLGPKVATGPEALSVSMYHVYSALKKVGADGPQMLNAVKIAAEGAKVGNTDLEDTTNSLTATLASGIVKFNQAGKAMGYLNAIVGAGDMKFSDLNQALGTGLLVTMKTFGVSIQDTGAALAVFGDNNIRGADAATKLRMSVQDIAKPAAHAGDYLAKINLTTDQLRAALTEHGLNDALQLLKTHLDAAGISGSKVGAFLEDAFTKKAGAGLAVLLTRLTQFDEARKTVQKGADGFGAAWKATTKTASFAFDKIKATVEAFGISLGTKMLPYVTKAADWLGKNLPGALRTLGHIVATVGGAVRDVFAAAWRFLLPVLKAAGQALKGTVNFLADHTTVVKVFAEAVIGLWAAFKGYKIAEAAFISIKAAVTAGGALDALRLKFMYAADGLKSFISAGGGGAAILIAFGVAAGLVGKQISNFIERNRAGVKVIQSIAAATGDWRDQLVASNGALTDSIRLSVAKQLQDDGLAEKAAKSGITLRDLTDATTGNDRAFQGLINRWRAAGAPADDTINALGLLHLGFRDSSVSAKQLLTVTGDVPKTLKHVTATAADLTSTLRDQVPAYHAVRIAGARLATGTAQLSKAQETWASMIGLVADKTGKVTGSLHAIWDAIHAIPHIFAAGSAAVAEFGDAWQTFAKSAGSAADRAAIIGATLKVANGDALRYQSAINGAASASKSFFSDVKSAAKSAKDSTKDYLSSLVNLKTGTIDFHKSAAGPLLSDLQSMQDSAMAAAQAQFQHAKGIVGASKAAGEAYQIYKAQTSGALVDEAKKLGLTSGQAHKLAQEYFGMPKDVKTTIKAEGTDPILTALDQIGRLLANITHQKWETTVNVDTSVAMQRVNELTGALSRIQQASGAGTLTSMSQTHARGGAIFGRGSGTSDSIPARLSNGEHVLTASDVEKAGGQGAVYRMRQAIQSGALKFARGGAVFDSEQRGNAAIIASVGQRMHMSARDIMIGIMAAITESGLRNLHYGDRDSLGLFQQRSSWGSVAQRENPSWASGAFFRALRGERNRNNLSPWMAAQGVQISSFKDGSNYRANFEAALSLSGAGRITVAHVGGKKVWQFGGQNYASLSAAQNARSRAIASASSAASSRMANIRSNSLSRIDSLLGGIGSAGNGPQINVGSTGIRLVERQIAAARRVLAGLPGLSGPERAKYNAKINDLVAEAQRQFDRLKIHIKNVDLGDLRKALKGTAADARAAFGSLITDLRHIAAPDGLLARLRRQEGRLLPMIRERNRAQSRLDSLTAADKSLQNSVKSSVTGFFDVTSAGTNPVTGQVNAGSMIAQQRQALIKIDRFKNAISKLGRRGRSLPPGMAGAFNTYLRQLAIAGPSVQAQVDALLQMSAGQFGGFIRTESQIDAAGGVTGQRIGHDVYGARERAARHDERVWDHRIHLLEKAVERGARVGASQAHINLDPKHANQHLDQARKRHNDLHGTSK